jgi:hypothetical protein
MDFLDELAKEQEEEELKCKANPIKIKPSEKELKQLSCKHSELYHSICLICDFPLSNIKKYREYALLGRGRGTLIHEDFAREYI